jgi:hypothetical protein
MRESPYTKTERILPGRARRRFLPRRIRSYHSPCDLPRRAEDRVSRGGSKGDGQRQAGRADLSHMEQSAAQGWRSEKPCGRQQPNPFPADGLSCDHCADGIYVWFAPGRIDDSRQSVQRTDANQICLRVRAGHAAQTSAGAVWAPSLRRRTILNLSRFATSRRLERVFNCRSQRKRHVLFLPRGVSDVV